MLALLAVTGCRPAHYSRIAGDWQMAVGKDLLDGVVDSDESAVAEEPKMTIRFFHSGQLETKTRMGSVDSTKTGSWELIEYNEQQQLAVVRCQLYGQETDHEIELLEDGGIRMVPPNLAGLKTKIKFVRQE